MMMRMIGPWCRTVTIGRLGAAAAGVRLSPRTAGGNQRKSGMGVARTTGFIEPLFVFAKLRIEEVFTGGSWVCPVAPFSENPVVVALGVGIEKRTGLAYKVGDSSATGEILCVWFRSVRVGSGRRLRWDVVEGTISSVLVLNGTRNEPIPVLES